MLKKPQKSNLNIIKTLKNRKNDKNKVKNRIKIAIHPVTIIFAILGVFATKTWLFVIYFFSILLHELCHAIVAQKLGYFCDKIVLYPSGALLFGETDEFTFKDEVLISLSGPFSNIILCAFCVILWWICPQFYNYSVDFVVANLSIAFFNLLPIFPLDGGRVVLAILSNFLPRKKACKVAKNITLIFAIILFIIFICSLFFSPNFQLGVMAVLVFVLVLNENKESVYKRVVKTNIKKRKLKHGLAVKHVMFLKDTQLSKVLSKIDNFGFYLVYVVDDNFNILATLSEEKIYSLLEVSKVTDSLAEVLNIK